MPAPTSEFNNQTYTGSVSKTYDSFSSPIDLTTDRPGYSTDDRLVRPRAIYCPVAGDIAVEYVSGDTDTITVTAGTMLPISPDQILATGSGTTVAKITVVW